MNLPDDYEVCGTCGFDHTYDGITLAVQRQIQAAHLESEAMNISEDLRHLQEAFDHRCAVRAETAVQERQSRPLYWLHEPTAGYGGRVYLLVARQIPGDAEFPRSWKYFNFGLTQDTQLIAAQKACKKLCKWSDYDKTEETSDALWYGYEFYEKPAEWRHEEVSRWDQIKSIMLALLGEPGNWPEG